VSFDDPMLDEAAKIIFVVAAKQHEGLFKPQRERDILTASLGNPEHPGRVRGTHRKKDGKKDSDWSGRVSTRNMIDTRKK
jgi:hypothetical protein